jgi:glutaconate CoA-transferase subunit A
MNLDVVSFLGGPEIDLLIGAGKIRHLAFAYVGFDALGLAPNFRKARETGALGITEYSEGLMLSAFEAAAKSLPFIPTRFGLGTDLLRTKTSPFKVFSCPLTGESLIAVPPLAPDVAIVHVNEADRDGNALIYGDAFADSLLVRAAKRVVLTTERLVDKLSSSPRRGATFVSRLWVSALIEAPGGGNPTAVFPDYRINLPKLLEYQDHALEAAWLEGFIEEGRRV